MEDFPLFDGERQEKNPRNLSYKENESWGINHIFIIAD